MNRYKRFEDYLVVLGGMDPAFVFDEGYKRLPSIPKFSLARYDVSVVDGLSSTAFACKPFTDRQGKLIRKLLHTYQKQLNQAGIILVDVDALHFSQPFRSVDRTHSMTISGNLIKLRFPFNHEIIAMLSSGTMYENTDLRVDWQYNKPEECWYIPITETSINYLVSVAERFNFDTIDDKLIAWREELKQVEQQDLAIELRCNASGEYFIANCPNGLASAVSDRFGYITKENLTLVVDASAEMGFSVSDEVMQEVPEDVQNFAKSRSFFVDSATNYAKRLANYINTVKRYPVYLFDPGKEVDIQSLISAGLQVKESEIATAPRQSDRALSKLRSRNGKIDTSNTGKDSAKLIYVSPSQSIISESVPLMISTSEIMSRIPQATANRADKLIYLKKAILRHKLK